MKKGNEYYKSRRNFDEGKFQETLKKRRYFSWLAAFSLAVTALILAVTLFGKKHYILLSFFLLLGTFLPFMISFRVRKPRAREVVLLSVMVSFCVAVNTLCSHTLPLHAGTAVVVLTGIALGPEAGFITGSLGRFLCNFFDGQGIWTPWQMVTWGLMGFLSGILYRRFLFPKNKFFMSIYTFFFTFVIYGGIMNFASMLMQYVINGDRTAVNLNTLKALYVAGIPYDFMHGLGAAICIFLGGESLLQKLERIQIKYGMYRI